MQDNDSGASVMFLEESFQNEMKKAEKLEGARPWANAKIPDNQCLTSKLDRS